MIGTTYWATGIVIKYLDTDRWAAKVEFYDSGFCDNESTEGHLTTRYFVPLDTAIDTIIKDSDRLGISFQQVLGKEGPYLFAYQDGESKEYPMPPDYKKVLENQAVHIGWDVVWKREEVD